MNLSTRFKRILAFVPATILTASIAFSVCTAYAASAYYIRFYDPTTKTEEENTTIVEGSSINIRASLPAGYQFSTDTPFAVNETGVGPLPDASTVFAIQRDSDRNYTLLAKANSARGASQSYTLDAIYTALISEASGSAVYTPTGGANPERFTLRAVAQNAVSITEDSKLTFVTATDQVDDMITFGKVTATNAFVAYDQSEIEHGSIEKDNGGTFIKMRFYAQDSSTSTPRVLELKVYLQGINSTYIIKRGTKFEISFLRQTINSMILTVVTPQKTVDDTISSVQQNPTNPEATISGIPYINLKTPETLESIQSNFTVLTATHRHNVNVNLLWEWVPDDAKYSNVLTQKPNSPSVARFEITNRPKEDVPGHLRVYASYTSKDSTATVTTSAPIDIRVIVYGTGAPPTVTPLTQTSGHPNDQGEPNPKIENISKLPAQMDVYRGNANFVAYPDAPRGPYQFLSSLAYGEARGAAKTLKITYLGDGGEIDVMLDNNTPYTLGADIVNPGFSQTIQITARKKGQVRLQFEFYNENGDAMKDDWFVWSAYINDSTPSSDGTLESLALRLSAQSPADQDILDALYPKPKGFLDYAFDPATNSYTISVPNKVSEIFLTPKITTGAGARTDIKLTQDTVDTTVSSGRETGALALEEQKPKTISLTVTAQDGKENTYTLTVTRTAKSSEATLKGLTAKLPVADAPDLVPGFSSGLYEYAFSVPYATKQLEIQADPSSPWAFVGLDGANPTPSAVHKKTVDLTCDYDVATGTVRNNVTLFSVEVLAEDGVSSNSYLVRITREPPNDNRKLAELVVLDDQGAPIAFESGQTFSPDGLDYFISIPYSSKTISITAKPEAPTSSEVALIKPSVYGGGTDTKTFQNDTAVLFKNLDVTQDSKHDKAKDLFVYTLQTTAESTRKTDPPYTITVRRLPPNSDNTLSSLAVASEDGTAVPDYTFRPHLMEYDISVPYIYKRAHITPVPTTPLSKVEVDGELINEKQPSVYVDLSPGTMKRIEVDVTAESGDVRTYVLRITRQKPSKEARLSNLEVVGQKLDPVFIPSKTQYEVRLPEAVREYAITPTAIDPYASITIDERTVTSGAPYAMPTPEEVETIVHIIVTAQDGSTKMEYTLRIVAEALIEKSSNADLRELEIKVGELSPKFDPAILQYNVAVKPDAASVTIHPLPADKYATVSVKSGSKELGDFNQNYAIALASNTTDITVTVESHDKTIKNEYKMTINRNVEGKEGSFKIITADMVDFETNDPIIVDISVYSMIAADVFNTMKDEYPDKTIIFKGNDYSLECKGSDIKQHVPNTDVFDFSMSFTAPQQEKIQGLLTSLGNAPDLNPVYVYFGHHGPLPASMKLTLSLGAVYGNRTLCWNYYNEDRERIDYYGNVSSNSQGTFSLRMSHMSTYLVTTRVIVGAENRVGLESGVSSENLSSDATTGKRNPTTNTGGTE